MSASYPCQTRKRTPLADATNIHNNEWIQERDKFSKPSKLLPHYVSLVPGSTLTSPEGASSEVRLRNNSGGSAFTPRTPLRFTPRYKKPPKTHVGPWQLGTCLGSGMSARVRKARHSETQQLAAVKIMSIGNANQWQTQSLASFDKQSQSNPDAREDRIPMILRREITILKAIEHPNVIKLFDVWENRGEMYLFMQFVEGGELFTYIMDNKQLPEHECVRIFRQIISGLQYCHRFRLCHRDLKPENILMDRHKNVKLADFGMAAMHHNKPLRTACGSPHYAAPEVCRGDPYYGDLADIWSSGVVLFVMLASSIPFGGERHVSDISGIIRDVQFADIVYPKDVKVSSEATDLVTRILTRTPAKRISIKDIWRHPLLTKYEQIASRPENRGTWIGGPLEDLSDKDCGEPLKDIKDIDRAIVEGLCTLWQTSDEERFVLALLDPAASYEKVLYNMLRKFRIQQEEHFIRSNLRPSTSDHHHVTPRHHRSFSTRVSLLGSGEGQRRSQFSIAQTESRRTSTKSGRSSSIADTETTYDPYRSSKPQVTYKGHPYLTIDVHRGSSTASRGLSSQRGQPVSSIWESTVASSSASVLRPASNTRLEDRSPCRALRHTGPKRIYSVSSFTSSRSATSGKSVQFVKSASHKRSVSFRRPGLHLPRPEGPTPVSLKQRYLNEAFETSSAEYMQSSPPTVLRIQQGQSMPTLTSPRKNSSHDFFDKIARPICSSSGVRESYVHQEDDVQAISELSNFCDEAFAPSPIPLPSNTGPETPTPVSRNATLAARLSKCSANSQTSQSSGTAGKALDDLRNRPLPDPPFREPHALHMQRDLAKLLKNLKEKERELGPGTLDTPMAEVERLMRGNAPMITEANYERRVASAPVTSKASRQSLSPVKEFDGIEKVAASTSTERRYFSNPLPYRQHVRSSTAIPYDGPTIRVVPKSPGFLDMLDANEHFLVGGGVATSSDQRVDEPRVIPVRNGSREVFDLQGNRQSRTSSAFSAAESRLHTIEEASDLECENQEPKRGSAGNKFKTWLRRSSASSKSWEKVRDKEKRTSNASHFSQTQPRDSVQAAPLSPTNELYISETAQIEHGTNNFENWSKQARTVSDNVAPASFINTSASEFPSRGDGGKAFEPRSGFWNFFRRHKSWSMTLIEPSENASIAPSTLSSRRQSTVASSVLSFSRHAPEKLPRPAPGDPQPPSQPQNWLARLLKIRPAHKILAFEASRKHVIRELRAIFREWRRHGVRDIVVDKYAGRIWARLDKENTIGVKPVEIMVEAFAVVYTARRNRGNAAGMSVVRMEQVKGAKSSFEKCAATMQKICGEKGLLVTDRQKAREMKKALKQWGR